MTTKKAPLVYLTRRETFSAAHRLWADDLSEQENRDLFGPCAYDHGHGHNYVLEVTLRGPIDPKTGILINLKEIRDVVHELIVGDVDHRHLNHDAPLTRGINPTAENLVVLFWTVLHKHFNEMLYEVRLRETEKNWVTYYGE
ncbi:6-carboxytetrahydropterin synthase [Stenotrophobium rhamnosiphilum]|uniref:6-carboxy-5,6,7,8-tetrahydropterin synthase n=1 Tax=Stenotrophobium rhamnosiphilum TaxID=2029166 RepID=A0A2T5MCN8_9GAMM|nr:6-carboxytetrahydropterin synthase [Stenotrophobium rhamnosiphilum]PTU30338.1 6-pyruvoyl tetrahydrobiopterin synthase [Stenotrophobium rhamnosiphilum]